MPTGKPGTGPHAGRKRAAYEPPRRTGSLSRAEKNLVEALAADQKSHESSLALERQVDRLARVLRRSPAAVQAELDRAKARFQARQVAYADLHFHAAQVAAAKGDAEPAQWALVQGRSIEPVAKDTTDNRVTVVVGMCLPGLRDGETDIKRPIDVTPRRLSHTDD
jgi:hypothetical protein